MTQAYAKKPIAYWLALAASATLGASWLSYFAYLSSIIITKQSVYMGTITVFAAVLLVVSGISLVVVVCSIGYLARQKHHLLKTSALWGVLAIAVAAIIFAITRPLINSAS